MSKVAPQTSPGNHSNNNDNNKHNSNYTINTHSSNSNTYTIIAKTAAPCPPFSGDV